MNERRVLFSIVEGEVTGAATPQQSEELRFAHEFLDYHARRIGERLGMKRLDMAAVVQEGRTLVFRYAAGRTDGVLSTSRASVPMLLAAFGRKGPSHV